MTPWIDGLPPAATARVQRQRASGTAGSLLSVPAAAGVRAAGLAPAGEVFGCYVVNLGWSGGFCDGYGLGQGGLTSYQTPVVSSDSTNRFANGFGPFARAVETAWQGALDRLLAEARALGADGVVGIRTSRRHVDGNAYEFSALGTAVRVLDAAAAPELSGRQGVWSAGLSGEDCAAAILSGFAPRGIAFGLTVATKHEDWALRQQRNSWQNTEVTGLTELLQRARLGARRRLATSAAKIAKHGDLVVTEARVQQFDTACNQELDLNAEATFVGTVLIEIPGRARGAGPRPVPVLALSDGGLRPAQSRTSTRRAPR
ncbi:MAG: heavy metal-binding domain-containing protein [Janthinobacterium lividum]